MVEATTSSQADHIARVSPSSRLPWTVATDLHLVMEAVSLLASDRPAWSHQFDASDGCGRLPHAFEPSAGTRS
jgi:hypothetical protein